MQQALFEALKMIWHGPLGSQDVVSLLSEQWTTAATMTLRIGQSKRNQPRCRSKRAFLFCFFHRSSMGDGRQPRLNIPVGNSPVTENAEDGRRETELKTGGSRLEGYKVAVSVRPVYGDNS